MGNGVLGQSSSDASPVLELIAGQIGESELGKEVIDKIDGLQEQIDALDGLKAYNPDEPYAKDQMVVVDGRIYQAKGPVPADASGANSPPNANLWIDVGQSVQTANGLAQQVQTNTTKITEVDGKVTATAENVQALRASARDDDPAGDMAGALAQWDATAAFVSEVKVSATRDEVIVRKTETLEATLADTSAAVQTVAQAQVDAEGKMSTMWAVKMQLNAQGQYVAASIGLGIENGPGGLQSKFLVSADTFAVVNGINSTLSVPFAVQNGQVFINEAFIADGTITNAKIGDVISSTNYVAGIQGWAIYKNGLFEMNGNGPGQSRLSINNTAVRLYHANGVLGIDLAL